MIINSGGQNSRFSRAGCFSVGHGEILIIYGSVIVAVYPVASPPPQPLSRPKS
jgi:hypothetical protein